MWQNVLKSKRHRSNTCTRDLNERNSDRTNRTALYCTDLTPVVVNVLYRTAKIPDKLCTTIFNISLIKF